MFLIFTVNLVTLYRFLIDPSRNPSRCDWLVLIYHYIGTEILERQTRQSWGAKVIDRLASDLREAFPEMKGSSSSNLKYVRFFAEMCSTGLIGQQPADQLPWFHVVTLLTKVSAETERE